MSTFGNTTMTCPTCAEPLAERGYFCKACASQARCKQCRELLEPGAAACVECGTCIGQPTDGDNGSRTQPPSQASAGSGNRNTISYHEDRNSRRFEASLTDSAMHGLGDVFGELFAQRGVGRNSEQGRRRGFTREIVIEEAKHLQPPPPPVPEQQHQSQFAPQDNTPKGASEKDRLLKIFNLEGEVLELRENRLKAKSAADYYKRLTYLFIYAQETLLGRSSTPKSELVTVLKSAKVYDPNCRYWLTQKKGFTVDAEDRMKLIAGAREQAVKALDEISDSNVADEWNPDTRTVKARTPRKKKP